MQVVVLGGGAAGLAAALAAAQGGARVTVLERSQKPGKKLLATGNGRCNLDNTGIAPERYFTADPAALAPLLAAVHAADPLGWFASLGLCTRTDEAGRVYPYSNQAADVLALLERHLEARRVCLRCGCAVQTLFQNRGGGYTVQFQTENGPETLRADAVICAMGGEAGPQFGTDGFGPRFAAQCGGRLAPLYPCLTALQVAKPHKALAGLRAKGTARLLDLDANARILAEETGEVQFTDYGLSGICIMQLSGLLAPGRGPKRPAVELDLFPAAEEAALAAQFAARPALLAGDAPAGQGPLGCGRAAGASPFRPACRRLRQAGPHRQALALCGPDPLRLEAGPDHRRRPLPQRGGRAFPVQGLPRPLLRGRNAGLCRLVRGLQPALGLVKRHARRPRRS